MAWGALRKSAQTEEEAAAGSTGGAFEPFSMLLGRFQSSYLCHNGDSTVRTTFSPFCWTQSASPPPKRLEAVQLCSLMHQRFGSSVW